MSEGDGSGSAASDRNQLRDHIHPFAHRLQDLKSWPAGTILEKAPLPTQHLFGRGSEASSKSRLYHLPLPHSHIVAMEGPALELHLQGSPWVALLYLIKGHVCIVQRQQRLHCSNGALLLVPHQSCHWISEPFSLICVMTAPDVLADMLKAMSAAAGLDTAQNSASFPSPALIQKRGDPIETVLFSALDRTLGIASDLACHPALIDQLGIDAQIQRLALALAFPQCRGSGPVQQGAATAAASSDPLEPVLRYIDHHLAEPLTLSRLEAISNYSRRSLQYAFRQRLGCTATQWIRARRLDRARALLLKAGSGGSVSAIAQTCGYRSMSLFSIEFQQRFHIKPSAMLRQSRQSEDNTSRQ